MMTRKMVRLAGSLLLAALVVSLGSCALNKVSIEQRITDFLSDLNTDTGRTVIYKNLHPDIQAAWRDPNAWLTTSFDAANRPFAFPTMTYGSSSASGTVTYAPSFSYPIAFTMKEDNPDEWFILSISVNGTPEVF